jgi:hypothetical protein
MRLASQRSESCNCLTFVIVVVVVIVGGCWVQGLGPLCVAPVLYARHAT